MEFNRKLKLVISYDGSGFHGWQTQAGVRTVQEELEHVARRVLRHPVNLVGASRTDAGVHARGQVAHVLTANPAPADRLRYALACRLPPDLTVVDVADVPLSFHATQHARGKLYRYTIFAARRPPALHGAAHRAWHVSFPLDLTAMRAAAARLVGRHDFAGFAKAPERRESTVRTISRIDVVKHFEEITIDVAGDGFLYNQIRIMVGSLMEIGRGHWPPERVGRILATRDRSLAGMTAPPQGLCLQWVRYPPWLEVAP